MQLAPGPIPPLTTSWYDNNVYDPGFSALEADALQDLPGLEVVMDALLDPTVVILDALPDDGGGDLLDTASGVITDLASYDPTADIAAIDASENASAESLLDVFQAIPGEAWQPVPGPAAYLSTAPGAAPTLGLGVTLGGVQPPAVPSFAVGSSTQLVLQTPTPPGGVGVYSGVDIQMSRFKNGVSYDQLDLGQTDAEGFIHYTLSFGAGDVGAWKAGIFGVAPDGTQLEPAGGDVFWNVVPAASSGAPTTGGSATAPGTPGSSLVGAAPHEAPPSPTLPVVTGPGAPARTVPPPLVTVTLANLTRPGATDFLLSENWLLTVQGPANSNVVIGGTGPGGPLSPVVLGQTDQNGLYQLSGFMGQDNIGSWSETYLVGSTPFIGAIDFTVYS